MWYQMKAPDHLIETVPLVNASYRVKYHFLPNPPNSDPIDKLKIPPSSSTFLRLLSTLKRRPKHRRHVPIHVTVSPPAYCD